MLYIDNRKIKFEARTYLKLVLGALFSIYCYLSILPKHGDFYSLNSIAQLVANGHFNFYEIFTEGNPGNIGGMHPPLFYIIYGIWMKLGSLLDIYNLDSMPIVNGQYLNQSTQFWCMIPYLLILLACTIITYKAFNNKWLSTIWFGSFTFICVIVMGQTDIFAAFFILISIVATIKSFNSDNYVLYLYLGLASLGISTLIKTYGYLLLPIYILVALTLINQNAKDKYLKAKIYSGFVILIFTIIASPMLFYGKWVSGIALGESSWAFNLQTFGVNPFHTISVWLFGYSIIIYMMYKKLIDAQLPQEYTNIFIFFCMLDLSWFFISVFTHPQWWVILVPFIIAVLDNFGNIFNYILASSIHTLFLFYPMRWVNNIDNILANYIWVTPIDGNNLIILVTLMTVTLAIWIIDLWQDLGKNAENIENRSQKKPKRNMALSLIILIFPFALIKLMPLMREIIALIR